MTSPQAWFLCGFTLAAGWTSCNVLYGALYGRRLRWPYVWAAQGALMFRFRVEKWEER